MEIKEKIRWLINTEEGFSFSFSNPIEITGPPILIIALIILAIYSAIWVFKDAKKKNRNPILAVTFIIVCSWPISILWWNWLKEHK